VLAVDAPLTPPYRGLRPVERLASRELGARLLPGGTPSMRALAAIGYSIKQLAWEAGTLPLETHPSTAYKLLGISRSGAARALGVGLHAADALAAAVAAACYAEGRAIVLEAAGEKLVFPARECGEKVWGLVWRAREGPTYS